MVDSMAVIDDHIGILQYMELILLVQCVVSTVALHNWFFLLIQEFSLRNYCTLPHRVGSAKAVRLLEYEDELKSGHELVWFAI
jgi:hypothetical protein